MKNTIFMTIVLALVTSAMLFVMSCGNNSEAAKSNKAEMSALTVSINSNDYDISFDADNTAMLIIPAAETGPGKVEVTAVSLSDGATGLAVGEELTITGEKIAITITAEDGSTQSEYTLAIMALIVEEMSKTQAMDRRYHYVGFTVQSESGANLGRFKFGLRAVSEKAPTASELTDGAGIYRRVTGLTSRNILAYTVDSGIGTYVSSSEVQNKVVLHGNNGADVDQYLLAPGAEYALYAMKDGSDTVFKLAAFSTDVFDENSSPFEDGKMSDKDLLGGQYVYDPQDTVFLMPYFLTVDELDTMQIKKDFTLLLTIAATQPIAPIFGTTGWSALFPSQTTDGTNYYKVAEKQVTGFFICIPQTKLGAYTSQTDYIYIFDSNLPSDFVKYQLTQDFGPLITGLSVTINNNDYPVTFSGYNAATISIPQSETIPATLTVKELTLLDGVTGVQVNDTVTISNGKAEITVSKDGASITYIITVANS